MESVTIVESLSKAWVRTKFLFRAKEKIFLNKAISNTIDTTNIRNSVLPAPEKGLETTKNSKIQKKRPTFVAQMDLRKFFSIFQTRLIFILKQRRTNKMYMKNSILSIKHWELQISKRTMPFNTLLNQEWKKKLLKKNSSSRRRKYNRQRKVTMMLKISLQKWNLPSIQQQRLSILFLLKQVRKGEVLS